MTRDEIKTLTVSLAKDLEDTDTIDIYINEVFRILAFSSSPPMLRGILKEITSGTATYSFESDMLKITYAIMFDELLSPCSESALDAYSSTQESDSGTPSQITQDELTARTYRLYPEPDTTSTSCTYAHGEPFGEDYPDDILTLIYADDRESNIHGIYSISIALDTLSREFAYPSDHTDKNLSAVCRKAADLIYQLVGV